MNNIGKLIINEHCNGYFGRDFYEGVGAVIILENKSQIVIMTKKGEFYVAAFDADYKDKMVREFTGDTSIYNPPQNVDFIIKKINHEKAKTDTGRKS